MIVTAVPVNKRLQIFCFIEIDLRGLKIASYEVCSASIAQITVWIELELLIVIGRTVCDCFVCILKSFRRSPGCGQLNSYCTVCVGNLGTSRRRFCQVNSQSVLEEVKCKCCVALAVMDCASCINEVGVCKRILVDAVRERNFNQFITSLERARLLEVPA
jgi:hypothetical protein